jgi:NitT/TauT family transport system permease protein
MTELIHSFSPNKILSKTATQLLIAIEVGIFFLFWLFSPSVFLPTPTETVHALGQLWRDGFVAELYTSLILNFQAILLASIVSLLMAYATVLPAFRPIVTGLSKLRFLSLVGLTFFFTLMTRNGHELKLSLLVFSVSVFFITGMAEVVVCIPKEKFDLARTLRMREWRVVWEVVVLGQIDKAFEVLRQNAAIGWMMLTMIEGMSRSEGGVGALLLNQNKHFHLSAVLAIQATILILGLAQDYGIGLLRTILCPYADLGVERR